MQSLRSVQPVLWGTQVLPTPLGSHPGLIDSIWVPTWLVLVLDRHGDSRNLCIDLHPQVSSQKSDQSLLNGRVCIVIQPLWRSTGFSSWCVNVGRARSSRTGSSRNGSRITGSTRTESRILLKFPVPLIFLFFLLLNFSSLFCCFSGQHLFPFLLLLNSSSLFCCLSGQRLFPFLLLLNSSSLFCCLSGQCLFLLLLSLLLLSPEFFCKINISDDFMQI